MRRCYLACYDIRSPQRWRQVYKILKGFGEHWQYSIFFCVLKDIDRVRLETLLRAQMDLSEDEAFILDLGPDEDAARHAAVVLGKGLPGGERGVVVV